MNDTPPKPRAKMGAPRKEIDWEQFELLCRMHATEEEFCFFFDVTIRTLNARCRERYRKTFSQVFKEKCVGGRMSLRRQLWQNALGNEKKGLKPHAATAIFLSKQTLERGGLGFSDKVTQEHEVGTGTYEQLMGLAREMEREKAEES